MPKIKITREKLYETVFYSLIKKGYHGTSIDFLAKALVLRKSSISHYGSKLDIFKGAITLCGTDRQKALSAFRLVLDHPGNKEIYDFCLPIIDGGPAIIRVHLDIILHTYMTTEFDK